MELFDAVPSEILDTVLAWLPTRDLIDNHVGRVCRSWYNVMKTGRLVRQRLDRRWDEYKSNTLQPRIIAGPDPWILRAHMRNNEIVSFWASDLMRTEGAMMFGNHRFVSREPWFIDMAPQPLHAQTPDGTEYWVEWSRSVESPHLLHTGSLAHFHEEKIAFEWECPTSQFQVLAAKNLVFMVDDNRVEIRPPFLDKWRQHFTFPPLFKIKRCRAYDKDDCVLVVGCDAVFVFKCDPYDTYETPPNIYAFSVQGPHIIDALFIDASSFWVFKVGSIDTYQLSGLSITLKKSVYFSTTHDFEYCIGQDTHKRFYVVAEYVKGNRILVI